ncbi:hypothetical protein [Gottfriedia solisilvae]|uniref:Uncharacterized protein n=1 Tax=Gottfriedia solisilvae TaxID=1516104 RepID=A0A8J3ACT4_9BACI|nr:hypothetical protein [Gottfriedia solisilvae]GGI10960.1 hypothetical protein GCM10007380_05430 [Gottfriedia solisilvae]
MIQTKWSEIFLMLIPVIIIPAILFIVLHSSPKLALRTHVFFNGHPILAFQTEIIDDQEHNKMDEEYLKKEQAKCYSLTKAPKERVTDSYLTNYIVRKKGFIYKANYYGNA